MTLSLMCSFGCTCTLPPVLCTTTTEKLFDLYLVVVPGVQDISSRYLFLKVTGRNYRGCEFIFAACEEIKFFD